jgi:arylformamidase
MRSAPSNVERFSEGVMKYHDVSVPISAEMPVFEGDPPVSIALSSSIERGDPCNVSQLTMGAHTGSHVDAPLHFLRDGKPLNQISLDILIGPARVVEVEGAKEISRDALVAARIAGEQRVLFKTPNSSLWREKGFQRDFVYVTGNAAKYLVEIGVRLVGIDYLSVEKFGAADPVAHLTLLKAGIVILEGLNLSMVKAGHYELVCLPLCIEGAEGAPCRAVLIER